MTTSRPYTVIFLRALTFRLSVLCVLLSGATVATGQEFVTVRKGVQRDTADVSPSEGLMSNIPYMDGHAFGSGERLSFSVRYKWGLINSVVGFAEVVLKDTTGAGGRMYYHCVAQGRTANFFDRIFKVREHFESWFSMDDLRPAAFIRDTKEGNYIAKNLFLWNRDDESIVADVFSSSRGQRYLVLPGRDYTYDLLTLFYFARNIDFDKCEENVRYPISFAIDDDIYDLYFVMLGREKLKLKGKGTYNTIKFAARLVAGEVFSGKEDMLIWVTDDRNRIPVYFKSPVIVGEVSGMIESYSGLKYPMLSEAAAEKAG